MKVPFSWLKEHVQVEKTPQEVADDLIRLGHEVEGIETPRAGIKGVRVGRIVAMRPHPNADKLKLLTMDLGDVDHLSIVCGASNMQEGDKVPVATVGTVLPNGLKIKKGKIRGETSFGMCCSEAELGLAEDADGLLILPGDAPVGEEIGEYLNLEEAVLDLDITPNRGDCMSIRGIARDLAADYGLALIEPGDEVAVIDAGVRAPEVSVAAGYDCPLYTACRIEGVKVVDSPEWLQARLIAAGLRPINGIVDIINYTMLDLGQPMHAFDADTLHGDIVVRAANQDEAFVSLEGKKVRLQAGDLVVADDKAVIALAGIMGSAPTGVSEKTTNIILESAAFRPARISITRRTCGLVSDASMRFERGVDPAMIAVAMDQAAHMIVDLFGGKLSPTTTAGDAERLTKDTQIKVDMRRIESRLGIEVPERADAVLMRMGFGIEHQGDTLIFSVPSHRPDVRLPEDISEEYARVMGFDAIPARLPALRSVRPNRPYAAVEDAVRLGFVQVVNYAFIAEDEQRMFVPDDGRDLRLANPISETMAVMRRSMFPSLLNTAKYNMNRQQAGVALVEHGRIYAGDMSKRQETDMLAWLMTGDVREDQWYAKARKADFFDLKGAVEAWLQGRGLSARFIANDTVQGLQAGQTADMLVGKTVVGHIGKVDSDIAAHFDLADDVFVACIDTSLLPQGKKARFQPIPEFPAVERDLVFLFDKGVHADAVTQTVRKACGQLLVRVWIFDWYDGKGVPEGKVSLGVRFVLQDAKRTLTQDDADQATQAVIAAMQQKFQAELRR